MYVPPRQNPEKATGKGNVNWYSCLAVDFSIMRLRCEEYDTPASGVFISEAGEQHD